MRVERAWPWSKLLEALLAREPTLHSLRAVLHEHRAGGWKAELLAWGPKHPMRPEFPKHGLWKGELEDDDGAQALIDWTWEASATRGFEPSTVELTFAKSLSGFDAARLEKRTKRLATIAVGIRPRGWRVVKEAKRSKHSEDRPRKWLLALRGEGLDGGKLMANLGPIQFEELATLQLWADKVLVPRGYLKEDV